MAAANGRAGDAGSDDCGRWSPGASTHDSDHRKRQRRLRQELEDLEANIQREGLATAAAGSRRIMSLIGMTFGELATCQELAPGTAHPRQSPSPRIPVPASGAPSAVCGHPDAEHSGPNVLSLEIWSQTLASRMPQHTAPVPAPHAPDSPWQDALPTLAPPRAASISAMEDAISAETGLRACVLPLSADLECPAGVFVSPSPAYKAFLEDVALSLAADRRLLLAEFPPIQPSCCLLPGFVVPAACLATMAAARLAPPLSSRAVWPLLQNGLSERSHAMAVFAFSMDRLFAHLHNLDRPDLPLAGTGTDVLLLKCRFLGGPYFDMLWHEACTAAPSAASKQPAGPLAAIPYSVLVSLMEELFQQAQFLSREEGRSESADAEGHSCSSRSHCRRPQKHRFLSQTPVVGADPLLLHMANWGLMKQAADLLMKQFATTPRSDQAAFPKSILS